MYVSAWGWFDKFDQRASENNDHRRQQLSRLAYRGWRYGDNNNNELAYQTFQEGLALAQQLGERQWELFFEYWSAQVLFYDQRKVQEALDLLVRLTVRCHKAEYADCNPTRSQIFFTTADAYFEVDASGYADEIRDLLDTIENDVPMDKDTHLRVMTLRADLRFLFEDYEGSLAAVQEYLAKAEGHTYRLYSAYHDLQRLAYVAGDIARALDYSLTAERYAEAKSSLSDAAECKLWQAVYHMRFGNEVMARSLYEQGTALFEQHDFVRWVDYYDAVCELHELWGQAGEALRFRQGQLARITPTDGLTYESQAHLQHCRLLGRMGQPLDEALQRAHAVAERMRKPAFYLRHLQKIEAGHYHKFDWQKGYREKPDAR